MEYKENFEMWCWRRMEKITWDERVINEVLRTVKVERNILLTIKRSKANWIGHIWRRKCLLKHAIEGKIEGSKEVTGRGGIRRRHLLGDLGGKRGFLKMKDEALDRTVWRTGFEIVYGPV
jgi:hypothetical protein